MNVLAIASSTDCLSVALNVSGKVFERADAHKRRHSAVLLELVGAVLDESGQGAASIEFIAVDVGPGAFTGVRTAVAAAQGLALAWSVPIVPISSLGAMRLSGADTLADVLSLCVLDARMGEVYHAQVDAAGRLQSEAVVGPPQGLAVHADQPVGFVLTNVSPELLSAAQSALPAVQRWLPASPTARGVLRAVEAQCARGLQAIAPAHLTPLYVRNQVAMTIAQRQELGHAA